MFGPKGGARARVPVRQCLEAWAMAWRHVPLSLGVGAWAIELMGPWARGLEAWAHSVEASAHGALYIKSLDPLYGLW